MRGIWFALTMALLLYAAGSGRAADRHTDADGWGVYAQLAGTTRQADEGGYRLKWRWITSGEVLLEEWIEPRTGRVAHTHTITRGERPGTLHKKGSYLGGKEWDGAVSDDGSAVFVGRGLMKAPYRVGLGDDGLFEIRRVKLRAGQVMSIDPATNWTRFALMDDAAATRPDGAPAEPASARTAPTPRAQAPRTDASVDPPATPRTAEELEAMAAALQEQARQAREAEAADAALHAQADADAAAQRAQADADRQAAQAEAAHEAAEVAVQEAQRAVDEAAAALAAFEAPPAAPRPAAAGGDRRDFWSYCTYGVIQLDGEVSHRYVTNLINQRIFDPYEGGTREEYDAYDGPNDYGSVERRFAKAMRTSGFLPKGVAYSADCSVFPSRDTADWSYARARRATPTPTPVLWLRLEDEQLVGGRNLPTAEELAALQRAAEAARLRAEEARVQAELARMRADALRGPRCVGGACPPARATAQ